MLLFIRQSAIITTPFDLFQYIPCYCLSWYVTASVIPLFTFQYIPCYCLSVCTFGMDVVVYAFQYIPCYCLSRVKDKFHKTLCISIHPMLLFIQFLEERLGDMLEFQYIPCYCLSLPLSVFLLY